MSFSLGDFKSILKYDDKKWKNRIDKRNVYLVYDDKVLSIIHDEAAYENVVILLNASEYQQIASSMALVNEILLPKDVKTRLFGQSIGRFAKDFTDVTLIGSGGYGRVYEAKNINDLRKYAIKKVVIKHRQLTKNDFNNALSEFRIFAALNHPGVVRYHTAWLEIDESEHESSIDKDDAYAVNSWSSEINDNKIESNKDSAVTIGSISDSDLADVSGNFNYKTSNSLYLSLSNISRSTVNKHWFQDSNSSGSELDASVTTLSSNLALEVLVNNKPNLTKKLCFYIQMELCNENLKTWIDKRNAIAGCMTKEDKKVTRSLARQLLSGLEYIHDKNIVHRDIKPANIFLIRHTRGLDSELQLKIGDFGLARPLYFNCDSTISQKLSANVGTGFYTAPEVMKDGSLFVEYNHKCDMYSAGVILLELMIKFTTIMELCYALKEIEGVGVNEQLSLNWPIESPYIVALLSEDVVKRPNAGFLVHSTSCFKECAEDREAKLIELMDKIKELVDLNQFTELRNKMKELIHENNALVNKNNALINENNALKASLLKDSVITKE